MTLPLSLVMTAAEINTGIPLPPHLAYMACHFSPYGTGLSNLPKWLPPGSMLILNDRTPIYGHDPVLICDQLAESIEFLHCSSLLLDFQRADCEETAILSQKMIAALPCPVGLSEVYARDVSCPVFLAPPPLDIPLQTYLAPWKGREIWLEAAPDRQILTLTPEGCSTSALFSPSPGNFIDPNLHIHYDITVSNRKVQFSLQRSQEDLAELLKEAESLGVTMAVGLWQELK